MSYEISLDVYDILTLLESQIESIDNRYSAHRTVVMNHTLLEDEDNDEYVELIRDELIKSMDKLNTYVNLLNKILDSELGDSDE